MKWLIGIGILLLFLISLAVGMLNVDNPLDPGAAKWLAAEGSNINPSDNGYLYLMGIVASTEEDPVVVGQQRVNAYLQAEKSIDVHNAPFTFEDYPDSERLIKPENNLFCKKSSLDCFKDIIRNKDEIAQLLVDNSMLRDRYQNFLSYDHFQTSLKPTGYEVIAPFEYLVAGNQALHLNIIQLAISGKEDQSLKLILADMAALRAHFPSADSLIFKIVLVSLIGEDIELLSHLYTHGYYEQDILFSSGLSEHLSKEERSLESAMRREYLMTADLYRNLDQNPDFFELGGDTPAWVVRALFKLNTTLNTSYAKYHEIAQLSLMTPSEFNDVMNQTDEANVADKVSSFSIRNYAGSILATVAGPNFTDYVARLFDLECKIKLLKIRLLMPPNALDQAYDVTKLGSVMDIANPYNGELPYVDSEAKKLCYTGPYEDTQGLRCISL